MEETLRLRSGFGGAPSAAPRPPRAPFPATYRFHGLFSVRVAHRGLADRMRDEFAPFLDTAARPGDAVDLTVEEGPVAAPDSLLSTDYGVDEGSVVLMTPSGRIRRSGPVVRAEPTVSPDLLYRQCIDNLMALRVPSRGAALVRSSAVSRDGVGYLFPGWAHSGKTDVALEFAAHGAAYMADDCCFVTRTGELLGYPRWLNLYSYHFELHPEFLDRIRAPRDRRALARRLGLNRFASSLGRSDAVSVDLRHRIEGRFFVHVRVPIGQVLPGCTTILRAPLAKACLLLPSGSRRIALSGVTPEALAHRVALVTKAERKSSASDQAVCEYLGLPSEPEDPTKAMTDVLQDAFRHAQCFELSLPRWPTNEELGRVRMLVDSA